MTTEFPFGHLLSNVVESFQGLARKSSAKNWLPRLKDLLKKLRKNLKELRMSLIDRATVRICYDCSRPIRPWDSRILVTEYTFMHRSCSKTRQFIEEFMHYRGAPLQPPE